MRFVTIAIGSASLFLIAAAVAQTAPPPMSFLRKAVKPTCASPDTGL